MVQPGERTLIKFVFTTPNLGPGDLVVGSPNDHPEWFEYSECHGHYHFREYADYRLWTPADYRKWDTFRNANPDLDSAASLAASGLTPIRGDKAGFCIIDVVPYDNVPAKYLDCGGTVTVEGQTTHIPGTQGITAGWADEYYHTLDGQWIDITGIKAGNYVLEAEVNAERLYKEVRYDNNRQTFPITIPKSKR